MQAETLRSDIGHVTVTEQDYVALIGSGQPFLAEKLATNWRLLIMKLDYHNYSS